MEEGGWKLISVIFIESHQKIKLNKNRLIRIVNDFHNLFLPSYSFKPASIRHSYHELSLNNKKTLHSL